MYTDFLFVANEKGEDCILVVLLKSFYDKNVVIVNKEEVVVVV